MNRTCGFADVHLTKSWTEHFKPPLEQMLVIGNRHPISMLKKQVFETTNKVMIGHILNMYQYVTMFPG